MHRCNDLDIQVCGVSSCDRLVGKWNWELTAEGRYPNNISPATAVPAWAYLDVVAADKFDLQSAVRLVNSTMSTSSSSSATPSATSTGTLLPASVQSRTNNTPAIIGGTVGGVLGLGLVVALVLCLRRQDGGKKSRHQPPSAAFARATATPDVAAAAGFRSASRQATSGATTISGGSNSHSNSNHGHGHGHRGPSPVFQLGYASGAPWSPPPPCATPSGAVSPLSAQSLLSMHNYGSGVGRLGGTSLDYPNSSSTGHGTTEPLMHSGSTSSMRSVQPHLAFGDLGFGLWTRTDTAYYAGRRSP